MKNQSNDLSQIRSATVCSHFPIVGNNKMLFIALKQNSYGQPVNVTEKADKVDLNFLLGTFE